jgi:TPR repeat protein
MEFKNVLLNFSRSRMLPETFLVFHVKRAMVVSMDKSWYRKLFSRPQKPDLEVTPVNTDYGDADVQFNMGLKFANGEGVAQDYAQAAEWYHKAADQSHSLAQFNLGMMYANGQGVTRDDAQSAMWFGRAAHQGDAGAQFNLGRNCHRASLLRGVPEDAVESRIEAYKWFHLAATQGYRGSEAAYGTLTLSMTHQDVATGNQRVAEFEVEKPKYSPG